MNTVKEYWDEFEKNVLDEIDAEETQRSESKKCFYLGAYTMLALLVKAHKAQNMLLLEDHKKDIEDFLDSTLIKVTP